MTNTAPATGRLTVDTPAGTLGLDRSIRLWVATPCYGGMVTADYMQSMLGLQRAFAQIGLPLHVDTLTGDSLIPRARNMMLARFLDHADYTHLMFIDADIAFSPLQVLRMLAFERDVVGGVYPLKVVDWERVRAAAVAGERDLARAGTKFVLSREPGAHAVTDGFSRVKALGTGFLLMRRSVPERMKAQHPELRLKRVHVEGWQGSDNLCALFDCMIDPETREYVSEDYTFCRRWRDMGGEIWADLTSRLTHIGHMPFPGDAGAHFLRPS